MIRLKTALTVVYATALCCCTRRESPGGNGKEPAAVAVVVAVAPAVPQDLERKEVLAAEFRPFQIIDVHAKVAGYLKTIYVDVGDHVKEGQTLALLEVPELADEMVRAKAATNRSDAEVQRQREELLRAESTHTATHLTYERLAGVAKTRPNLIAQQEIDDAQARDQSSEATVSAARAALVAAQQGVAVSQADVAKTETMNAYSKITAPFAGVITKRYADTGAMIPAGTATTSNGMPLVQLSQNSLLRLVLPVPEADVSKIHVGQAVEVRVKALNRTFQGKITRFADSVSMTSRTMDTQVDVQNPSLILIPGMYAEAVLSLDKHRQVISIPVEGVNLQGSAATAYVVGPDHKIAIRPIQIGMETAESVEVLSGLRVNEMVVVSNRGQLTSGQVVEGKLVESAKGAR